MFDKIKEVFANILKSRILVLTIIMCILSFLLLWRVFNLQIINGQEYLDNYTLKIEKTRDLASTRGNIYDKNGKLLAYNELAYAITLEDNGVYNSRAERNKALNKELYRLLKVLDKNKDQIRNDFYISYSERDGYQYTVSGTTLKRFLADIYDHKSTDDLKYNKTLGYNEAEATPEQVMEYLSSDKRYGISDKYSAYNRYRILVLRYAIAQNSYQKFVLTVLATGVSDETVAWVSENSDTLQGMSVNEETVRKYNDSKYFAHIIGYTGQISTDEYDTLSKEDQEIYSKTDTVGKSGLEKVLDSTLRGKKGEVKLYVNNVGKVLDTVQSTEPKAGNDVYLSLDANLQKAAYNILEQELAGILLSKIQNTLDFDRNSVSDGSDVMIPIGDVYNALIANDVVNMTHFSENDAKSTEQEVYNTFSGYKEQVLASLSSTLADPNAAAYKDDSKEMQAYLSYIVTDILTNNTGILNSSVIDKNDETYKAWKTDETINVYTFLNYAVSQNWIDTSKLQNYTSNGGKYSDSSETFQAIISYLNEHLQSDNSFDKLIYKYMIKAGSITGRELCMILYEQNILNYDESQYNALASGATTAYDFMRGKIQTLEITPGQLGLEPCTGSFVMTDTSTGQVLACVSYPGYDNNRLANNMDSTYYNQLVTASSRPFYNNATQEKTAPGSTYKPLSAIAGLTEGVISTDSHLPCHGIYEKIEPNPKCWIYPNAHGSLDVSGAIENSCNSFFYEVGYRLSLKDNGINSISQDNNQGDATNAYYSSELGLQKLSKYAQMFGLGTTSGMEIPEADPQISDDSSVPSAIGQGTNNYTTSQLARYVTTIANKGTLFDLTLLNKTTDVKGNVIEESQPKIDNTLSDISASTWDAVHEGMRNVVLVSHSSTFSDINRSGFQLSGKTGTAQQSKTHPDHALFIGFAPSDSPEVAFATRIANGYSSTYAAEVARDVMKYYYQLTPENELITGTASSIGSNASNEG